MDISSYLKNTVHWEIHDRDTRQLLHRDTQDLSWLINVEHGRDLLVKQYATVSAPFYYTSRQDSFEIEITCSNPPEVSEITCAQNPAFYQPNTEYEFSIQTEPGCRVVWRGEADEAEPDTIDIESDTLTVNAKRRSSFRLKTGAVGSKTWISATVHRPEKIGYCYTRKTLPIDLGNDKPILPLTPFQRDQSFSVFVISRLGWLLIALPLLLAGWFFYRWRKKRNTPAPQKTPEELADQYPVVDAGPYFIPYRSQEHSITVPREFFRIAEVLRRREEGQRRYFDGPATVRATIESGGFPAWRERAVTRPSEYLFLVERPDERDQQGKLFTRLCDFLKRRDVPLVTFFHDGSFQHFWNAEYANGLPPNELRRRYPHHRLVLLGAAHGLVNPYATRQPELLRSPLDWMLHWQRRLLITPEPVAAWSFQEALLHRHFLVFPADTEGILSGIDLLDRTEEYHPSRFEGWQEGRALRHSPESHRYRTWKTAADHTDYLRHDPDCFRWLCALAVCAQPDWSLTLAVGRAIGVEVTHDRLLLLTHIPWLSQNLPNDGLRLELLRQLSPADELAARQTVAHELEAVRSLTANSFAETERTANAAIQNFALDPRDEAHKQAIRELRTLGLLSGSQEAELDFIVQEKADPSGLPNSASEGIEGWLDVPAPKRFWTWEMGLALLALALSAALLLALSLREKPFPAPFDGLMEDVVQSSELMELNEQAIAIAERVLAVEDWEQWLVLQDSVRVADSLFQLVVGMGDISVSAGIGTYGRENHLGINMHIFRYDVAVKTFNFYQTGDLSGEGLKVSVRIFQQTAQDVIRIPRYAKDSLTGNPMRLSVDAEHGQGLCHYYRSKYLASRAMPMRSKKSPAMLDSIAREQKMQMDSARLLYESILRNSLYPNYFDSIQATIPVNLQTLLEAEKAKDKGDPADTDEAMRQKILGHWIDEKVRGSKNIIIFRKDGTATVLKYVPESNRLEDTGSGRWSVENKALEAILGGSFTHTVFDQNKISYLDNNRLTLDDGTTWAQTYRRIQPTDRDRDGVLDVVDNCPDEKGVAENGGCPEGLLQGRQIMRLLGHSSTVTAVAFSPDGKYLLTGSDDNTAKLWDVSGQLIMTFLGHTSYVKSVAFSPDGKRISTGSSDQTAKIWDLKSGKNIITLSGHSSEVWRVAFSPDGKQLATGSDDNTAKIWDLVTGKEIMTLSGHTSDVWSVAFSPNGKRLVTGSSDKTARIWDLKSGKEIIALSGHNSAIRSVAISPNGNHLATGSDDNTAKIWDLESGKEIETLSGHKSAIWSVAFSPNGNQLATGSDDYTAKIWELGLGKAFNTLEGHTSSISSVAFSTDGKRLATGSSDNTAIIWYLGPKHIGKK